MSSIAAADTRSSTVARNSAQLNFSIATCFQRSRSVVFAASTSASSNVLFLDFRITRLGSTKSGRRPPVTACSSKAIRPSRSSLAMCCSKERPARDFRCWLALRKVASKSGNPRTTEETNVCPAAGDGSIPEAIEIGGQRIVPLRYRLECLKQAR